MLAIEDIKKELEELRKQYLLAVIAGDQKLISFYKSRVHSYEKFIECFEKGAKEYEDKK